ARVGRRRAAARVAPRLDLLNLELEGGGPGGGLGVLHLDLPLRSFGVWRSWPARGASARGAGGEPAAGRRRAGPGGGARGRRRAGPAGAARAGRRGVAARVAERLELLDLEVQGGRLDAGLGLWHGSPFAGRSGGGWSATGRSRADRGAAAPPDRRPQ